MAHTCRRPDRPTPSAAKAHLLAGRSASDLGDRLAATAAWMLSEDFASTAVDHIAKVRIEGTITEDEELLERLEKVRKSTSVKGVILSINSPGGTTAGGEAIFDEVTEARRRKACRRPGGNIGRIRRLHDRQRLGPHRRAASPRSSVRSAFWCSFRTSPG